jgi:hypothetical protein
MLQALLIIFTNATWLEISEALYRKQLGYLSQYSVWQQTGRPGVRSPEEAKDSSSSLCVQTGSEAHSASYPVGTGGPFPGGKERSGRDADHSPPCSAEVKN